jgi:N-acetylglutamate synthase-like GNAT family acetyltransferase
LHDAEIAFARRGVDLARYETGALDTLYVGFGQAARGGEVLEAHYHIRPVTRDEEKTVRAVIASSFALDMNWSDTLKTMKDWLEARLDEVFEHKVVPCLVVTHGTRVIGASPLDPNREAECHLVSGPCILNEYRNRGIGTELLFQSLNALREAGFEKARAITKSNVPVAKFVYTKFNSVSEPWEFEPVLARS